MSAVASIVAGLLLAYVLLVAGLVIATPSQTTLTGVLRLMPDLVRLIRRLAADPALSRGVRARLWILLAYLAMPFDLIPDFVPVVGYADDAILVSLVLRSVVRRAGRDTLKRNWPGTTEGLSAIERLTGLVEPRLDAPPADTLAGTRSRLAEGDRQRCSVEAPS